MKRLRLKRKKKAEEQYCQEVQNRYRLVSRIISDLVYSFKITDGKINFEWILGQVENFLGFSIEELDSIGWESVLLQDEKPKIEDHKNQLLSGKPSTVEFQIVTKDGKLKRLRDIAIVETDSSDNKTIRVIGVIKDLTSETLARERIAYLAGIVESSGDAIICETTKGNIVGWNEGARKMLGRDLKQTEGKNFSSFLQKDIVPKFEEFFQKAVKGDRTDGFVASVMHSNGKGLTLLLSLAPITTKEEVIVGIAIVGRDITAVKKAENDLILAHSELNQIFGEVNSGICLIDRNGEIVKFNKAFREIFDRNEGEIRGRLCCNILGFHECVDKGCPIEKIFGGEKKQILEIIKNINGKEKKILFSCSPFKNTQGGVALVIGSFIDITTLRDTQTELRESREQLLQAEKLAAIGELASGVAHEINQPLNHISITAQIMEKMLEKVEPKQTKILSEIGVIFENIERVESVITTLRDFSRKETGGSETIDPECAIKNILNMFGMQIKNSGINLKFENLARPFECRATKNKFGQVILNVLLNARNSFEFPPKTGDKTIEITLEETPEEALIKVKDNGCGIPKETLSKVFLPFFTTKPPGKGTGLGLSISRQIINDFGGKILINSEYGIGTEVLIFLKKKKI